MHQVEHSLKQIGIGVSSYGTLIMKRCATKATLWLAIVACCSDELLPIGNLINGLVQQESVYR